MADDPLEKALRQKRTAGFATLRDGCIHLRCPRCGRKQSNMPRDPLDPPNAVLIEVECERHSEVGMEPECPYFDANGDHIFLGDNRG